MTNSIDIIANSISLIQPDGTLQTLTVGGTIAPVNNPTFTGNVGGVTKDQIGLGNVENTSDLNKPISISTQSALNTIVSNTNATFTSQLGMINSNAANLTSLVTSTNNTFASQLTLINTNKTNISTLNTSVTNINSTLTSQLGMINSNATNLTSLVTSTNNTFTSQLLLINNNTTSISSLNTSVTNINSTLTSHLGMINSNAANLTSLNSATNATFTSHLTLINTNTTNISSLNTSVSNINTTLSTQLPTLATQTFVTTSIANLVGGAPAALDTLYELSNAISNNSNFSTTMINSIANVGVTASTALTTAKSILTNVIPTLATKVYVDATASELQPYDITGVLTALPNNLTTSNAYFSGFPNDNPSWTSTNSATYTNVFSLDGAVYQQINLPNSSSNLYVTTENTYPLQSCRVTFSVMLGSAASISVSVTNGMPSGAATYATATYTQNLSTTQYTNLTLVFTTPAAAINLLNININGGVGSFFTKNWSVFVGSAVVTQIRGNLNIPYGTASSADFLYGAAGTSLISTLSTLATTSLVSSITASSVGLGNVANTAPTGLPISTATQTALNLKANISGPSFTGTVSGITSAMVGLGNVANTAPSGLPISTATQAALNAKLNISGPSYTGTLNNSGNSFIVDTFGSISCNTVGASGNIQCVDLSYSGNTSLMTKIGTLAPLNSTLSFTANTLTASAGVTCSSLRVNNNAEVIGDVLYGLGPTSLTTTINSKANLSGAAFTGDVSTTGNVSITGSYGAWSMARLNATSYAANGVSMSWKSALTSRDIIHATDSISFQVNQAGTYFVGVYAQVTSTQASGVCQFVGKYSTNLTTYTNVLASQYPGTTLVTTHQTLTLQGLISMAANSYLVVDLYHTCPNAVTLNANAPLSYLYMYRIG